jgi:hypothetical protein
MGAYPVNLGIALSEKEFYAELKALGIPLDTYFVRKDAATHCYISGKCMPVIIIAIDAEANKRTPLSQVFSLICHESVHAWQMLCEHIGETRPGEESSAYNIQWISQFCIDKFQERIQRAKTSTLNSKPRRSKTTKR